MENKKFYVSGNIALLDVGAEVEAENQFMAVIIFSKMVSNPDQLYISGVEEVK